MKLGTLYKAMAIQGGVRLSIWDENGDELEVAYLRDVDSLASEKVAQGWRNKTVKYMFAGEDGFLHIEVQG